jgi:hypothetical protein
MITTKSPRKVIRAAHRLATACLPQYSDRFSRHDFTLPQLFACLVIREHQKKSYRGVEAPLSVAEGSPTAPSGWPTSAWPARRTTPRCGAPSTSW